MLFTKAAVLLASALAVVASPIAEPEPEANSLEERGTYTCGNAYDQCQGSGKGNWVCWADKKTKTCGKWGASDLLKHKNEAMSNYCKGVAYCCTQDATVAISLDIDILHIIDIDVELVLQASCKGGKKIWSQGQ